MKNEGSFPVVDDGISSTTSCPMCSKPSIAELRPFCSKRCANLDLHRWLSDGYVIPAPLEEQNHLQDEDEE